MLCLYYRLDWWQHSSSWSQQPLCSATKKMIRNQAKMPLITLYYTDMFHCMQLYTHTFKTSSTTHFIRCRFTMAAVQHHLKSLGPLHPPRVETHAIKPSLARHVEIPVMDPLNHRAPAVLHEPRSYKSVEAKWSAVVLISGAGGGVSGPAGMSIYIYIYIYMHIPCPQPYWHWHGQESTHP